MPTTEFYERLLECLNDAVFFVDGDRRIQYWNRSAELLTGYERHEVVGRRCQDGLLMHVDDQGKCLCEDGCPLQATIEDGVERSAQVWLKHKQGHRVPVVVRATPIRNQSGEIVGAAEIFHDAHDDEQAKEQIAQFRRLAYIDPLTGVANRRYLMRTIQSRHTEFHRYGWTYGVMMVDLDHFKDVNDAHGHSTGDRILQAVANTLEYGTRPSDLVGRWGGEEFMVLTAATTRSDLEAVAERLRGLVAASQVPVNGSPMNVTISIGATHVGPNESAEAVIHRADELMYRSKETGRNRVTL